LARGELVANLTASDLPQHLADLARAPRERATGAVRWQTTASHQVAVPSLVASRARLECRVIEPAAQPAVSDRGVARSPTGYVVIAEVVCVVTDDDQLAPPDETPERAAGRVEFPVLRAGGPVGSRRAARASGDRAAGRPDRHAQLFVAWVDRLAAWVSSKNQRSTRAAALARARGPCEVDL
jgi:hypothetical protein